MYDLEIGIPFCQKYEQRFKDFKKIGLTNIGDYRVHLTLLIGNESFPAAFLYSDWPEGVDIEVRTCDSNHWIPKLANYYLSLNPKSARWFVKLDDDSVNDVSSLIDDLDFHFDHERDYYIATEVAPTMSKVDQKLVRKFGYTRWFENKYKSTLCNEWECSIVSRSCIERMLHHPHFVPYFQERSAIPEDYGDAMLAMVARMCKIYPIEADFITKNCAFAHLTRFGGRMSHIHYVCRQSKPRLVEFLIWHEENRCQELQFTEKNGNSVVLKENGKIVSDHPILQHLYWYEQNKNLILINNEGTMIDILKKTGNIYKGNETTFVGDQKSYLRM